MEMLSSNDFLRRDMPNSDYFIATGDADHLRLKILNEIYNPTTYQFLIESGLKEGMIVLEYGCGAGYMACLIAKHIGPTGEVIAIDKSQSQLDIAHKTAEKLGVSNVKFVLCDVNNLEQLDTKFDFAYGRWILEFSKNPENLVALIRDSLNYDGVFVYETSSIVENAHFSYPHEPLIDKWYNIGLSNFKS
jgi:ubiquinone/menaquinone biosynthesis C-methylase UbiE